MAVKENVGKRDKLIDNIKSYLVGHLAKHRANIDNLLDNGVALAEHPDIIETIEKELGIMAEYQDKLELIEKYFPYSEFRKNQNING